MSETTNWAPERIYLQREQGEFGSHTWCEDSVGDGDLIEEVAYVRADAAPKLAVWYGPMPESNGKTNWTAILHNGDIATGITLDRSEYPDRVRYEADRARWLIGELAEEPFILDYDADKHSGYVPPTPKPRFPETFCSSCGKSLGAGDSGVSHCGDHE